MPDTPVKTLFITGFGRSGSTIVDNIIGQMPGVFSVGELQYLWDRGMVENRLCACGAAFDACQVWTEVLRRAFGDEAVDAAAMIAVRESLSPRSTLAEARREGPLPQPLAAYASRLAAIYAAVVEVTGCRVIVDSSKSPGHGFLLGRLPGVDLRVLHLVRDPRAVAYSWSKTKVYDDGGDGEPMLMSRHPAARSAKLWMTWNVAAGMLWRKLGERYLRMRYEDFARDPRAACESIAGLIEEPVEALPFAGERTVNLEPTHACAGNPSRFKTGPVEIRADEAWRGKARRADNFVVGALTLPLRWRYGY